MPPKSPPERIPTALSQRQNLKLGVRAVNHVVAYALLTSELATYRNLRLEDLRQLLGQRSSRQRRGNDGVDYVVSVIVRWRTCEDGDIRVTGYVGEAAWGGPHDSLDETFVVQHPSEGNVQ